MAQVEEKVGLTKRTLWRKIKAESFPTPVPLGEGRAVGFVVSEVEEWMKERMAARVKPEGSVHE